MELLDLGVTYEGLEIDYISFLLGGKNKKGSIRSKRMEKKKGKQKNVNLVVQEGIK